MTVIAKSDATIVAAHMDHVHANGIESLDGVSLETATGGVLVECCTECAYAQVTCTHDRCDWDADGTQLTCRRCGLDVT